MDRSLRQTAIANMKEVISLMKQDVKQAKHDVAEFLNAYGDNK